MSDPFIFISTHRLKEGKKKAYQDYVAEFVPFVRGKNPDLRAFYMYLDEDGEHVSVVQVHAHPGSMLKHMEIVQEHVGEAYENYLEETVSMQIFGEPTDKIVEVMEQLAGGGVPVSINRPFDGFDRLAQQATAT